MCVGRGGGVGDGQRYRGQHQMTSVTTGEQLNNYYRITTMFCEHQTYYVNFVSAIWKSKIVNTYTSTCMTS